MGIYEKRWKYMLNAIREWNISFYNFRGGDVWGTTKSKMWSLEWLVVAKCGRESLGMKKP